MAAASLKTKLALVTFSLLFTVAAVEIALRAAPTYYLPLSGPPAYPGDYENRESKNFVADSNIGWRIRANHEFRWEIDNTTEFYKANEEGFRVDPRGRQSDGTSYDIVVAGDSFAFGTGVDYPESFGAVVERALETTRVHNLAMPGFGIDQIWMTVRHHGIPKEPELVVFAFIDNDFARSLSAYRRSEGRNKPTFLVEAGQLRRQQPSDRPLAPWRFFEGLRVSQVHARGMRLVGRRWPIGAWWNRNAAILEAVHRDCEEAGVQILFVRLPSLSARRFPLLERTMNKRNAAYLDLGTSYPDGIHFATDSHINERGHHWVAEQIVEWIANEFGLERVKTTFPDDPAPQR